MQIKSLDINNLRVVGAARIEPHAGLNLFIGDNGAGKTTLLEALIVLAKGRSFRGGTIRNLIGSQGSEFRIVAQVEDEAQKEHRLGLERGADSWRGRIDGSNAQQLTEFSGHLPLVLMEPNSHLLISGPPETRRRFMDWGVFHVKHDFLSVWGRYRRALRQRNAALRAGDPDLVQSLDPQLAQHGEQVHRWREAHLGALVEGMTALLRRLSPELATVNAQYRRGWSAESLAEALETRRSVDLERGMTSIGPHRADLVLYSETGLARDRLSRGEQKMVAVAMILAQAVLLSEQGVRPVLLLDDLASEFDARHLRGVIRLGRELALQCWITGVEQLPYQKHLHDGERVFHVKHGAVSSPRSAGEGQA